jgi:hypothetical protein
MSNHSEPSLSRSNLNKILTLTQGDRECELITCTAFLASGISNKSGRNHYGFENIPERL